MTEIVFMGELFLFYVINFDFTVQNMFMLPVSFSIISLISMINLTIC